MAHNPFLSPEDAHGFRRYLITNTPEYVSANNVWWAANAVVNTADTCPLTCANCLYSAAVANNLETAPPRISIAEAEAFAKLASEAGVKQVVFSGGGESPDNLPAMEIIIAGVSTLEHVVVVTSAYFSTDSGATEEVLGRLAKAVQKGNLNHERGEVTVLMRLSFDNFHKVEIQNIVNVIEWVSNSNLEGVKFQVVIRTILEPSENKDVELASALGSRLYPQKLDSEPTQGLPVIDGFPTRWVPYRGEWIPVIYKPNYFEGMGSKQKRKVDIPGTNWREVKQAEEGEESFFNLSLRGPRGEGHNYYGTILLGYGYWQNALGQPGYFVTPKTQKDKGYSIYMPANGRLYINASAPDVWFKVTEIQNWQDYLTTIKADILQDFAISVPTDDLLAIALEVEPDLGLQIDKANFVFSIPRLAMQSARLRLYLTIRLLQNHAQANGVEYQDPTVEEYVQIEKGQLMKLYAQAVSQPFPFQPFLDPIVGDEPSIYGGWYAPEVRKRK